MSNYASIQTKLQATYKLQVRVKSSKCYFFIHCVCQRFPEREKERKQENNISNRITQLFWALLLSIVAIVFRHIGVFGQKLRVFLQSPSTFPRRATSKLQQPCFCQTLLPNFLSPSFISSKSPPAFNLF